MGLRNEFIKSIKDLLNTCTDEELKELRPRADLEITNRIVRKDQIKRGKK